MWKPSSVWKQRTPLGAFRKRETRLQIKCISAASKNILLQGVKKN